MKNNWLTYLLFTVVGIFVGALLFSKCGKAKVIEHWNTTTIIDTVELKPDTVKIPAPYPVLVYKDSIKLKYVVLTKDSLIYVVRDSIHGAPVIAAKEYKDSVRFSGNNASAVLHYDLISTGELLRMDYDIDLFSTKECPDCPVPKRLKNSIQLQGGFLDQWFVGVGYGRNGLSGGLLYGFRDKTPGVFTQLNIRF